jgi:hypothetical protein
MPEAGDLSGLTAKHILNTCLHLEMNRAASGFRPVRQPGLHFRSFQVSRFREGTGNILANARRQYERYMALAEAAGDAVEAQIYYQPAEHFFRVMRGQEA